MISTHLEEIETIIFNLCNNIDILNTNKRIDAYCRENHDVIQRNKARFGPAECEPEEMLEAERAHEEPRRQELLTLEIEQKKKKEREKEALVDELMTSGKDAKAIVSEFVEKVEKLRKKCHLRNRLQNFPVVLSMDVELIQCFCRCQKSDDGPLKVREIPMMYMNGPQALPSMDLETKGFIKHIRSESDRENAGGFHATLACQRALQEAMQGLNQAHPQSISSTI